MNLPEVTPEMQAIMDETMAELARGELAPPPMEIPWERRRDGEPTPNYLGRVLDEAGLGDLARRAREGHFDDYQAPADAADGLEMVRLVAELRGVSRDSADPVLRTRIEIVENAIKRGEFDATRTESDRWAASADGQRTLGALAYSAQRPGRNDPCPCGSGQKWKRCHGA